MIILINECRAILTTATLWFTSYKVNRKLVMLFQTTQPA